MNSIESEILKKIDNLDTRLDSIDRTLIKQQVLLDEHIRRTELLEEKLEPIERKTYNIDGVIKFIGFLGILAGLILGMIQILQYL